MTNKEQVTIVVGTNRKDSKTAVFAKHIHQQLQAQGAVTARLLSLSELSNDWIQETMYTVEGQSPALAKIQDEYITCLLYTSPSPRD